MTCESCAVAESNPMTARFNVLCDGCKARALAQGRNLSEGKRKGIKSPEYAEALRKMFGSGNEEAGHKLVLGWSKKLRIAAK